MATPEASGESANVERRETENQAMMDMIVMLVLEARECRTGCRRIQRWTGVSLGKGWGEEARDPVRATGRVDQAGG